MQVLYRKWRPCLFSELVGQEHVATTLKNQVKASRTAHAYLLCGTRGTGKTSCARILAKAANCEDPQEGEPCGKCESCLAIAEGSATDISEIDAASNNGVDNVRALREEAVYSPVRLKKRVYIIDEVHMLSTGAFNALLKLLEEPPGHVLFILATTESHKVPATVASRCQRFDFKRITQMEIAMHLQQIAASEGVDINGDACMLIARLADGAMRNAIGMLEQCGFSGEGKITAEIARRRLGIPEESELLDFCRAVLEKNLAVALEIFEKIYSNGVEAAEFFNQFSALLRDIIAVKSGAREITLLGGGYDAAALYPLYESVSNEKLIALAILTGECVTRIAKAPNLRLEAEMSIGRLCVFAGDMDISGLALRIEELERKISAGIPVAATVHQSKPLEIKEERRLEQKASKEPKQMNQSAQTAQNDETLPFEYADELMGKMRNRVPPGLFAYLKTAELRIKGNALYILCENKMTEGMLKDRELVRSAEELASEIIGREITVRVAPKGETAQNNTNFDALLGMAGQYGDVIKTV